MSDFKAFWKLITDLDDAYTSHYRTEAARALNENLDWGGWEITFVSKDKEELK